MVIEGYWYTNIGSRSENEDSCTYFSPGPDQYCAVICDGLGGHGGGKAASSIGVKALSQWQADEALPSGETILAWMNEANRNILATRANANQMKTTAVALYLYKNQAVWAHIGDSRLYHFHNGVLADYTEDHSLAQLSIKMGELHSRSEIPSFEGRSKLFRVIGDDEIKPHHASPRRPCVSAVLRRPVGAAAGGRDHARSSQGRHGGGMGISAPLPRHDAEKHGCGQQHRHRNLDKGVVKMKRITAFLGCVCLFLFLLCPAVSAQAAELNSFLTFHEIVTEEHQNDLLVYGTVLPENGSLTVSIDSQQISDPVLTTVRQEKLPTTVYCLVDISTHMSKEQIEQQTDILDIISSRMGEGDSMVITTVGSKVVEGAVLDTMDARTAAIDTLKRDGVRADMYSAIVEAMGSLEKKTSYCTNRCLLILSDGILADGGTTQQRAIDVVSATSIPVYAIGITGSSTSAYSLTNADNMLKMAEVSRGGIGLVPAEEKISAAAAAQQVWETIQDGSVIKIDLAFVTSNSNNATVRAAYELGDTRWEDSVAVDLTTVPAAIPAAPTGVTDPTDVIEEPEAQTSVMDWVRENLILVICCAVALVAVIVVIVVVAVNNSRKKQEQWLRDRDLPTINNNPVIDNNPVMASIPSTGDFDIPTTTPVPDESWVATKPVTPSGGVTVQMTVASHQDVSTSFTLAPHTPQVLGRDDRADIILNAEDYQLSGKHCTVEWDGSYLYIQDMGSTNGTVLNGTNLKPDTWSRVKNGAVLHMGSFDYQVALNPEK